MKDETVEILVCSCDKYDDVWEAFFTLLFRYWSDCPYRVNLIANRKVWNDGRVTTLHTDAALDWSSCFLEALSEIRSPYVLVAMEDYLLTSAVKTADIRALAAHMSQHAVQCLHVFPEGEVRPLSQEVAGYPLGEVDAGVPYRVNLQAALWSRDYLMGLVRSGESAWDFEVEGSVRSAASPARFLSVMCAPEKAPFPYYCTAVVRGEWMPGAVRLCVKEGIALDFSRRKIGWVRGAFRDRLVLQPFRHLFVYLKRLRGIN